MVNSKQVINGVMLFMENHMIPNAKSENQEIILRAAKASLRISPNAIWDAVKNIGFFNMLGIIEDDHLNLDLAAEIVAEAIGNKAYCYKFHFLGDTHTFFISRDDIHTLKNYIERA